MTTSRWRQQARADIEAMLAQLPAEATRKDGEKAMRFVAGGYRCDGTSWPYQCFLKERKRALNRRWPDRVPRDVPIVLVTAAGVRCSWCDDREGGCIGCSAAWAFYRALPAEGVDMLKAVEVGEMPPAIFADWLEETGRGEFAGQWRKP